MPKPRKKEVDFAVWLTPDQVRALGERFRAAWPRRARLRLRTVAEQVTEVALEVEEAGENPMPVRAHRPIEDVLRDLAADIPEEAWSSLPPDLTDNLDHYLYGTPRQQ